jgi:hypothetical protein
MRGPCNQTQLAAGLSPSRNSRMTSTVWGSMAEIELRRPEITRIREAR